MRHIEVNQLWVQEKVPNGDVVITRVKGLENLADALTKNLDAEDLRKHVAGTNCSIESGRHHLMPAVTKDTPDSYPVEVDDQEDQLGVFSLIRNEEEDGTMEEVINPVGQYPVSL